jgi:Bax protein
LTRTLWLARISREYGLNPSSFELNFQPLLERVDIIPTSLILAQAANESAWGTSKFARLANNYFGQWCFTLHCGMIPSRRDSNKRHEVRKFLSPGDSVRAYLLNLNTNMHYALLRSIRADLRSKDKPLRGNLLSMGLVSYSERGHDYIQDIQAMISINSLENDDFG